LETFPTVDRPALSRLEGHRRIFATLRARGGGFDTLVTLTAQHLTPLGLAWFTALGFISETLVCEEQLLPRSEYKFGAAVSTFE
jgi:hypothetical protein